MDLADARLTVITAEYADCSWPICELLACRLHAQVLWLKTCARRAWKLLQWLLKCITKFSIAANVQKIWDFELMKSEVNQSYIESPIWVSTIKIACNIFSVSCKQSHSKHSVWRVISPKMEAWVDCTRWIIENEVQIIENVSYHGDLVGNSCQISWSHYLKLKA